MSAALLGLAVVAYLAVGLVLAALMRALDDSEPTVVVAWLVVWPLALGVGVLRSLLGVVDRLAGWLRVRYRRAAGRWP